MLKIKKRDKMMNFIRKIFENKSDESVHVQFQKFSRGEFKDKALIDATILKDKVKISTSNEFANEFVKAVAEKLGSSKAKIKGVIVTTFNLDNVIDFQSKKQFMGVKQYCVDKEMSGAEIKSLCDKYPAVFFALSFESKDAVLKIKAKAPKSAKPSTKGEGKVKADFCKIETTDKELAKDILFDVDLNNSKQISINHKFIINEIILPKDEKDYEKIRVLAKRKGKIIRKIIIDGKETTKEKEFVA